MDQAPCHKGLLIKKKENLSWVKRERARERIQIFCTMSFFQGTPVPSVTTERPYKHADNLSKQFISSYFAPPTSTDKNENHWATNPSWKLYMDPPPTIDYGQRNRQGIPRGRNAKHTDSQHWHSGANKYQQWVVSLLLSSGLMVRGPSVEA
jgi:hypothetical protein